MRGFRLRLFGSLREPHVRIKDETECRHCSAYLAWDERVPSPFAWIAPRVECPDQTGDRGHWSDKWIYGSPTCSLPSQMVLMLARDPPSFLTSEKADKNLSWYEKEGGHCVLIERDKRSQECLIYVQLFSLFPFSVIFFWTNSIHYIGPFALILC